MSGTLNNLVGDEFVVGFARDFDMTVTTLSGHLWFLSSQFCMEIIPFETTGNARADLFLPQYGVQSALGSLLTKNPSFAAFRDQNPVEEMANPMVGYVQWYLLAFRTLVAQDLPSLIALHDDCFVPIADDRVAQIATLRGEIDGWSYVAVRLDADPDVTGVDYPQINGIEGEWPDATAPPPLNLNGLLMKVGASETDFVSCSSLAARGLLLSTTASGLIGGYRVMNYDRQSVTVNERYADHRRELEFWDIAESNIVDFSLSSFERRLPDRSLEPVTCHELADLQTAVWEAHERTDGTSVAPVEVRLTTYPDLFRFPFLGMLVASRGLFELVRAHQLTGCTFHKLPFAIR